jgi:hypothetical protein
MSAFPSARVAAKIRKELGVEVDEIPGAYGEFTVLVDGEPVVHGQPLAVAFAMIPAAAGVVAAVRERLKRES